MEWTDVGTIPDGRKSPRFWRKRSKSVRTSTLISGLFRVRSRTSLATPGAKYGTAQAATRPAIARAPVRMLFFEITGRTIPVGLLRELFDARHGRGRRSWHHGNCSQLPQLARDRCAPGRGRARVIDFAPPAYRLFGTNVSPSVGGRRRPSPGIVGGSSGRPPDFGTYRVPPNRQPCRFGGRPNPLGGLCSPRSRSS